MAGNTPVVRWWLVLSLLVGCHIALGVNDALRSFPTVDEIGHLPAGVSHWSFGRFDLYRVNPPLVRMIATVLTPDRGQYDWGYYRDFVGQRSEFDIGLHRIQSVGLAVIDDYRVPRFIALGFSLVGLGVGVVWLYQIFGMTAAPLAFAGLWAFCPSLLAHAATLGPDVGAVSMGVIAGYLYWRYLLLPSTASALLAGIGGGLAALAKLTWITGMVSFPVVVLAFVAWNGVGEGRFWSLVRTTGQLLLAGFVSLFVINAGYGFEGTGTRLGQMEFCSQWLGGEQASIQRLGNRFRETAVLTQLPIPVPRNFLLGVDYLKMEVEQKAWSFLAGQWKQGSWPYYYLLTIAWKTPEVVLLAAAFAAVWLFHRSCCGKVPVPEASFYLLLLVPASVILTSVSLQGGFNHHHRYVLSVYPPLFAIIAGGLQSMPMAIIGVRPDRYGVVRYAVVSLLIGLTAASVARVHPYYTNYFNRLSGGPENGWKRLGSSNTDWGQNLPEVHRWLQENPNCRPVYFRLDDLDFNGPLFGLPRQAPPPLPAGEGIDSLSISQRQWWIVSVKQLYNRPGEPGFEYLQAMRPVDRIGYAYHVYDVDPTVRDAGEPQP